MTTPLEFLTVKEVATKLRVSPMTVYRLIGREELRATRVGRSYRIPVSAANAWVRDHTTGWDDDE